MSLGLIWAQSRNGVIGLGGRMPWHLPEDLARFKAITGGDPVIMGRRTWESIPDRFRPLPGRQNIVISTRPEWAADGATVVHSVEEALGAVRNRDAWVIGGAGVFSAVLDRADVLEVTEIDIETEGDTFAPEVPAGWPPAAVDPESGWHTSRTGLGYRYLSYRRSVAHANERAI
ncbi:MAG: dihydrofolate reductase [Microbacteriaceae bacterium]